MAVSTSDYKTGLNLQASFISSFAVTTRNFRVSKHSNNAVLDFIYFHFFLFLGFIHTKYAMDSKHFLWNPNIQVTATSMHSGSQLPMSAFNFCV